MTSTAAETDAYVVSAATWVPLMVVIRLELQQYLDPRHGAALSAGRGRRGRYWVRRPPRVAQQRANGRCARRTVGRGREILDYLPGRVVDIDFEMLTLGQISSIVEWTRAFHHAVEDFSHPGPWRYFPITGPTMIGHNDIAPYNICFDGDDVAWRTS